jgi:hypothetical protein
LQQWRIEAFRVQGKDLRRWWGRYFPVVEEFLVEVEIPGGVGEHLDEEDGVGGCLHVALLY